MTSIWQDNSIQFTRLLAEIYATQEDLNIKVLAASMDLDPTEIDELFERAEQAYAASKQALAPAQSDTSTITQQMVADYAASASAQCIFCKSEHIDGGSIEIDGNSAFQEMGCNNCDAEWQDEYTFATAKQA